MLCQAGEVILLPVLARHEPPALDVLLFLHLRGRFMLIQKQGSPFIIVAVLILRVVTLGGRGLLESFALRLGRIFDSVCSNLERVDLVHGMASKLVRLIFSLSHLPVVKT